MKHMIRKPMYSLILLAVMVFGTAFLFANKSVSILINAKTQ